MDVEDTNQSKIAKGESLKNEGNELFKAGELSKAVTKYRTVFAYVNGLVSPRDAVAQYSQSGDLLSAEEQAKVRELKISVYNNLAAVYLKMEKYDKAAQVCDEVLGLDDKNTKALFRKGQAFLAMKKFEKSKEALMAAYQLDPENRAVRGELQRWKTTYSEWARIQKEKQKEQFAGKV